MGNHTIKIQFWKWRHDGGEGTIKFDNTIIEDRGTIEYEIKDNISYVMRVEGMTNSRPPIFNVCFYENNLPDAAHTLTVQANLASKFELMSLNRYATDGVAPQMWTFHIGDTYDLREISGGDDYGKYTLAMDVAFIKNGGATKITYPVIFRKYDGSIYFQDNNFGSSIMAWRTVYGSLNPSEHEWFNYQSSSYIEKGAKSPEAVELNSVANVFYERDPFTTDTDNMRIVLRCEGLLDLDLGEIQTITDNYTSQIQTIPILPYGHSNAFCMDTGVTRSITVNYVRTMSDDFMQPDDREKPKYSLDSRAWSNARWLKELRKYTNRWQQRTNGLHLYMFRPGKSSPTGSMDECYPAINPNPNDAEGANWVNAYITQCPINYATKSTNMIESSITFQIGTIYPKSTPSNKVKVTLVLKYTKDGKEETVSVDTYFTRNSISRYPPIPSTFYNYLPNMYCNSWLEGSAEHAIGDAFVVGDVDHILVAKIFTPSTRYYYDSTDNIAPILKVGEMYEVYAIGGGGAGGDCGKNIKPSEHGVGGGGGGGAGFVRVTLYEHTAENTKVSVHIGDGGTPHRGQSGDDGGDTYLQINDGYVPESQKAKGGKGGGMGGGKNETGDDQEEEGVGGRGGNWGSTSKLGWGGNGGKGSLRGGDFGHNAIGAIEDKDPYGQGHDYGLGGGRRNNYGGGGGGGMPDSRFKDSDGKGNCGHGGNGGSRGLLKEDQRPKDGYLGGGGGGATDSPESEEGAYAFGKGGKGMLYIVGDFK